MPSNYLLLDDLRKQRNSIERTMSGLRPDDGGGARNPHPMYEEWEDAMEDLSRMYRIISDLMSAELDKPPNTC